MSLINDMLKDLEKRPKSTVMVSENLLVGLSSSISSELHRNKQYYYIILLLTFFLLTFVFLVSLKQHHTKAIPTTAKAPTINSPHNPVDNIPIAEKANEAMLTGIALQLQQNMTYLRFLLNTNTLYRLNTSKENNDLIIILEHTRLMAALPKINYNGSGIESLQAFSDENHNLKLVLHLSPSVDVKRLELKQEGKAPELQVDLNYIDEAGNNKSNQTNTIPVIVKKPIAESLVEQQYQLAMKLSSEGRTNEALLLLKGIVIADPLHAKSRELLASLLIQDGNNLEAKKIIDAGLYQQTTNYNLIELKARLLVQENKLNQATSLLEKGGPDLAENPDYHALVAALYQREGKSALAANLYKQLVTLQPRNAKWWLGLGVALDSAGNTGQAIEAFNHADSIGNLNPELQAYVESRLHIG